MRQEQFYLGSRSFQIYPSIVAACRQCGCQRTDYEKSALVDDLCLHCRAAEPQTQTYDLREQARTGTSQS